jgi:1,4-alpha-glucan branching enzyme
VKNLNTTIKAKPNKPDQPEKKGTMLDNDQILTFQNQINQLIKQDPYLEPYIDSLLRRSIDAHKMELRLTQGKTSLSDFASGHEYFGLHWQNHEWIFREWAPNATAIYLIGDMSQWREEERFGLEKISPQGIWEIRLPAKTFKHQDLYRLSVHWPKGKGDRLPAYCRRVVQDPHTLIFNAQVWQPSRPYQWQSMSTVSSADSLLIYEAHVGIAQEEGKVGSFNEFTEKILPRILDSGYNALQLMAIQEHPYYGSFGYHVSNFFALSSRFGTPEDFKHLVDTAHQMGLRVIIDMVHSHAANNEVEGLSRFDGTDYQYFHTNHTRGKHLAWDSRCFDYSKPEVLHFLLSNCRYWLDEYHLDGFRFDGITSMLYYHHGLGNTFTHYDDYFNSQVDEESITYLILTNKLIHALNPSAITIAEDVSGMPGLAAPLSKGGIGFDFRFAMGVPDFWTKLVKDIHDEDWPISQLWHELNNRRWEEKTISYVESHDQALVGDQSLMFRMVDKSMYDHMQINDDNLMVDRGMALHKMIRLITLATAGHAYLNFMGNEFGHPEWVDFPREGNNWSYHYARRQWSLVDNPDLKYHQLNAFDKALIQLAKEHTILNAQDIHLLHEHNDDKIIAFLRNNLLFVFNFHPTESYTNYRFNTPPGEYRMILNTDTTQFGGHQRLESRQIHFTRPIADKVNHEHFISLYLPSRTGIVMAAS